MKHQTKSARNEAFWLALMTVIVWLLSLKFDFAERFEAFFAANESWQADEIFLAITIAGLGAITFAYRRMLDLRRAVMVRDAAEGRAIFAAYNDIVTGLFNRRYVETRLPELCARDTSLGTIIAIDLDGFKKVNDLLGHQVGDKLLAAIAGRLTDTLPMAICARIGGDEFLVVAPRASEAELVGIGRKLHEAIGRPISIDGLVVEVGASLGIAVLAETNADLRAEMRNADLAMYAAKRDGAGSVRRFEPAMLAGFRERIELESAFRAALQDDLIQPHYQPLIQLDTGEIRGFEALARWTTASGTSIPPVVFIALAEETGLITELSERLLRRACADAKEWPESAVLTFNLSPLQFADPLLGLRIIQILKETGLPPSRLEIEMTESAVVADFDGAIKTIRQLQDCGIKVALDDFGTGFSSLGQLANMPFDKIKIDRSFTRSCGDSLKQTSVVRSIIGLGHGIGVATLAEGIETTSQLELLKQLGCEYGQGFLFARPMPAARISDYLGLSNEERLSQSA
ncbi:putative bifunctional diguanylate cyclase/phosphodiesterase [Jiella mangrovi]|uniref:EAL domain-containing protein n=1 Tax=Jiella mangrovi TaxID=2821407 RepID=A0ABS4BK77_9HYPH|nr:EAL domain-containing protein [Jiella mangrovi]MBP0617157.1 EAL domain-containing protein [Jiella mangrovi]